MKAFDNHGNAGDNTHRTKSDSFDNFDCFDQFNTFNTKDYNLQNIKDTERYVAMGIIPDLCFDMTADRSDAATLMGVSSLAKALSANPDDVATLVALGALAKGNELTPAQKQAACAAADAVCAAAESAIAGGDPAIASHYGQLHAAFSALNGAGMEGYFKKGAVESALADVNRAMQAIARNHSEGSKFTDQEVVHGRLSAQEIKAA